MRSGTLAQMLLAFPDDNSVLPLLESDATIGALLSPPLTALDDGPVLWVYGPQYGARRLEDIPAYVRQCADTLWYVRPAKPAKAINVVRDLLDLGCPGGIAAFLTSTHKTLAYREARTRATRGVCPCCGQLMPTRSSAA